MFMWKTLNGGDRYFKGRTCISKTKKNIYTLFSNIGVRYYTFKLLTAETMPPEVVIWTVLLYLATKNTRLSVGNGVVTVSSLVPVGSEYCTCNWHWVDKSNSALLNLKQKSESFCTKQKKNQSVRGNKK